MLLKIKLIIIKLFASAGISISKSSAAYPVRIRDEALVTPRSIAYFLHRWSGVVIEVPLDRGRASPINSFGKNGNHPFVVAAQLALAGDSDISKEKMDEVLEVYYRSVAPKCAAQLMGLSEESTLSNYPAWGAVMPWYPETIDEWRGRVANAEHANNCSNQSNLTIEDGWAWTGPVSEDKRQLEVHRLSALLRSVVAQGYQRSDGQDGDIKAVLLVNEREEWVWQAMDAQHRAAVVSALGLETVPVRVSRVIRREEAKFWPNVVRGLYSVDEALLIFDNIFYGRYSHVTGKWDDWLTSNRQRSGT